MAYRNFARDQAARNALTPQQQAALDAQETIIPDPRGAGIAKQQDEARGAVRRLLAFVGQYNPFGRKKP